MGGAKRLNCKKVDESGFVMKIGDVVAFSAGLDRHVEFGKLMRIEKAFIGPRRIDTLIAVIQLIDRVCMRSLKRVKSAAAGRKLLAKQVERNAKRRTL